MLLVFILTAVIVGGWAIGSGWMGSWSVGQMRAWLGLIAVVDYFAGMLALFWVIVVLGDG